LPLWTDALNSYLREHPCFVKRAVVFQELASTQDTARDLAGNQPGLLVIADHQTSGRGRLGRPWVQRPGLVLAATFTISTAHLAPERLSLIAGLAAARAIEATFRRR
jgi:BirA family biotin operon repressor/biotin-[acetyl-CoA-carboxylase] ligase